MLIYRDNFCYVLQHYVHKNATGSSGTPIVNRNSVPYLYCKCPQSAMEN